MGKGASITLLEPFLQGTRMVERIAYSPGTKRRDSVVHGISAPA